jgi:hypothetical protein
MFEPGLAFRTQTVIEDKEDPTQSKLKAAIEEEVSKVSHLAKTSRKANADIITRQASFSTSAHIKIGHPPKRIRVHLLEQSLSESTRHQNLKLTAEGDKGAGASRKGAKFSSKQEGGKGLGKKAHIPGSSGERRDI